MWLEISPHFLGIKSINVVINVTTITKMNEKIKQIVTIGLVIGVGLFVLNQAMTYLGLMQCLKDPCKVCEEKDGRLELNLSEYKQPNLIDLNKTNYNISSLSLLS